MKKFVIIIVIIFGPFGLWSLTVMIAVIPIWVGRGIDANVWTVIVAIISDNLWRWYASIVILSNI